MEFLGGPAKVKEDLVTIKGRLASKVGMSSGELTEASRKKSWSKFYGVHWVGDLQKHMHIL